MAGYACIAILPPQSRGSPFDSRNRKSQSDMGPYFPGPGPPFAAQYPCLSPSNCLTARQVADQNLASAVSAAGREACCEHSPRSQESCFSILELLWRDNACVGTNLSLKLASKRTKKNHTPSSSDTAGRTPSSIDSDFRFINRIDCCSPAHGFLHRGVHDLHKVGVHVVPVVSDLLGRQVSLKESRCTSLDGGGGVSMTTPASGEYRTAKLSTLPTPVDSMHTTPAYTCSLSLYSPEVVIVSCPKLESVWRPGM